MIFNRTPKLDAETVSAVSDLINTDAGMALILSLSISAGADLLDKGAKAMPLFGPIYNRFVDESGVEGLDDFADFLEFILGATGHKKDSMLGRMVDRIQMAKGFSTILKNFKDSRY